MLVIRTLGDLAALAERAAESDQEEGIILELTGLTPIRARMWQEKFERYAFSCGCQAGIALVLISTGAYVAFLGWRPESLADITWSDGVRGLGVVVIAALVGKAIGLGYAGMRLRLGVKELEAELRDS